MILQMQLFSHIAQTAGQWSNGDDADEVVVEQHHVGGLARPGLLRMDYNASS